MTVSDLEDMYNYGYWANRKVFDVISQLTPEQFTQTVTGSYGSIRNTLVHVMSAEWGWLSRCGGPQRGDALKGDDFPTTESLQGTWHKVEACMREFLSRLKDDDLIRIVEFQIPPGKTMSMALGQLLHHGAIHGVHHRGQVALLLRSLGYTPGNFDMLIYYAEKSR